MNCILTYTTKVKNLVIKTPLKKICNKKTILASGLKTIFFSENLIDLRGRIKFILKGKQPGNNSNAINEEMVAIIEKMLQHKCITPTQHKKH